jgi:hypothetical protein
VAYFRRLHRCEQLASLLRREADRVASDRALQFGVDTARDLLTECRFSTRGVVIERTQESQNLVGIDRSLDTVDLEDDERQCFLPKLLPEI